jgi:hypothetical protein
MAFNRYSKKLVYDENKFWYRPDDVKIPEESYKYISTYWNDNYTWFRLSYLVYGNAELYWLLMMANNITNPYGIKNGDKIRVLLSDYLNEVIIV